MKRITIFIVSFAVLGLVLRLFTRFLDYVETRPGRQLNDIVLNHLPPVDVTWPLFAVIYGCLLIALVIFLRDPPRLLLFAHSYTILTILRFGAMSLAPLEPPRGMIMLRDPVVQFFVRPHSPVLTKDLFFSGHTSLLFLLACLMRSRTTRLLFFSATAGVAGLVLLQHVHYTIDVVAAPFFSLLSYRLARTVSTRLMKSPS